MSGVPHKPSARAHVGTRTNQGSRIDYITETPYLHHQLGVHGFDQQFILAKLSKKNNRNKATVILSMKYF